jgi:hypothetical protein
MLLLQHPAIGEKPEHGADPLDGIDKKPAIGGVEKNGRHDDACRP